MQCKPMAAHLRRWAAGAACLLVLGACGPTAGAEGAGGQGATPGPAASGGSGGAGASDHAAGGHGSTDDGHSTTADSGTAADAGLARRAAAQLEIEALPGAGGGPFEGRELDPPLVTPRFTLTDTDGEPFTFARDATRPVTLLYFGYTSCPDVCPAHMAAIGKALSDLPDDQARQVQVLFVSVDTVNDDGEQLRAYLDNFDRDFVGLTGTADEVNAALRSVGLAPTAIASADAFPPAHPSDVLAYTADGRSHVSYPFGSPPSAFAADIPKLVDSEWDT